MSGLTKTQIAALYSVHKYGHARKGVDGRWVQSMGGAHSRMLDRLIEAGYMSPRCKLAAKGYAVLLGFTPHDEYLNQLHNEASTAEGEAREAEAVRLQKELVTDMERTRVEQKTRRLMFAKLGLDVNARSDAELRRLAYALYFGEQL